jgi:hypothetical protein
MLPINREHFYLIEKQAPETKDLFLIGITAPIHAALFYPGLRKIVMTILNKASYNLC